MAMSNLTATADRLRAVRKAREHFLTLWTLDCIFQHAQTTKRLLADLQPDLGRIASMPIMPRLGNPNTGK